MRLPRPRLRLRLGLPRLRRLEFGRLQPRPRRLRTRVVGGVLLTTMLALAAFDFAAVATLRSYLFGHADIQLQEVLAMYRPLSPSFPGAFTGRAPGGPFAQQVLRRAVAGPPRFARSKHLPVSIAGPRLRVDAPLLVQYYVGFAPRPGEVQRSRGFVVGDPNLQPRLPSGTKLSAKGPHVFNVRSLNGQAQLRLAAIHVAGGVLFADTSLAGLDRTVTQLEIIVVFGSAAAVLLAGLGVTMVMRRGLRPIERMAAQADAITAGDLTRHVSPYDARTEVGRLGAALNGMLTRIDAAMHEREASQEATRRFFADASHELRTPLASLRANAELYQQGVLARPDQVDEAMRRITLEAQRMSVMLDDMLRLARLDQHPDRQHEPVDMTALVGECADRVRVTSPDRTWRTDIADGLETVGDEELLRRAIGNLLANVATHTPPGTSASVTAAREGGRVTVSVSDDGPGVPADRLPRIFERFHRAGAPSPRPGSGLGLAIASAIASAHGGTAGASLNEPHGLRVTLTLPAGGEADGLAECEQAVGTARPVPAHALRG